MLSRLGAGLTCYILCMVEADSTIHEADSLGSDHHDSVHVGISDRSVPTVAV